MNRKILLPSLSLLLAVTAVGAGLHLWKRTADARAQVSASDQAEPAESVTAAVALPREYRRSTTAIGTVLALRSVTLRNELAGTVREVRLAPGAIVEAGDLLVALDVSVEEAELRAFEAQAALAATTLRRVERLARERAAAEADVERAVAERDVALARIASARAVIERKTIRAPFRARVGLADVHPGQFLEAGTVLTSLQGVDDAAHVDFSVTQQVAAELAPGDAVEIVARTGAPALEARIVAVDARIDPVTRNASVRARIDDVDAAPSPGSSVRVRVATGPGQPVVAVPADALRRGPAGDQVFVIEADADGVARAFSRQVRTRSVSGDEVLIEAGLEAGERVATSGSFKLRESVPVSVVNPTALTASRDRL